MTRIKTLELFAGSQSFSRVAKMHNLETFTVDWKPYTGVDLVIDIGEINLFEDIPYSPDVVWASPDCTTYSKAAGRFHRVGVDAVSDYARKCDEVNTHFLGEIMKLYNRNENLIYFIENPQGKFRKMPFILDFMRETGGRMESVTYCQYGYKFMKPTNIFTNSPVWKPRKMCFNGNPACNHSRTTRGKYSGVLSQSKKNRSKIPQLLIFEIIESVI